ncbi:hypothetical protein L210DRAFT_3515652, partial [Boletus edulis BED1]
MASKPKASLGEGMGLWSENAACGTANTSLIWGDCPRKFLTSQAMSGLGNRVSRSSRRPSAEGQGI